MSDLTVALPPLSASTNARSQHNTEIVWLPALDVSMDGHRRDSVLTTAFPPLAADVEVTNTGNPHFTDLVRALNPAVWWSWDQGDTRPDDIYVDQYSQHWMRMVDKTGGGYDAGIKVDTPPTFPDGLVTDELATAIHLASGYSQAQLHPTLPATMNRNPLAAQEFSGFVVCREGQASYPYFADLFGRGTWMMGRDNNVWKVRGNLPTWPYYWEVAWFHADADGYAIPPVVGDIYTFGFTVTRGSDGIPLIELVVNGEHGQTSGPQSFYGNYSAFPAYYDDYASNCLGVGNYSPFNGEMQHSLYFRHPLSFDDFQALHAAATASRPKRSEIKTFLPALSAQTVATQPNTGPLDVEFPALDATMSGYKGVRTAGGGHSWHEATELIRGELTAPSQVMDYAEVGPDDPEVFPYHSAWWKWVSDGTEGTVWFSTLRSMPTAYGEWMDTVLVVYVEDGAGGLTQVAYNDDVGDYSLSQVVIDAPTAGTTYYIRCGTYDTEGSNVQAYVLDNDLVPPPTLADLIVVGGTQSPSGYIGVAIIWVYDPVTSTWSTQVDPSATVPILDPNSISAPTVIAPGEQAWWRFVAASSGSVSFDALLSQDMFSGGAGTEGPDVDLQLWSDGDWLAYSDSHGTVDYQVNQGQITWDVNAGQTYYIKVHKGYDTVGNANVLIRVTPITLGEIQVPAPRDFIIDATSGPNDGTPYVATTGDNALELTSVSTSAAVTLPGFHGAYHLMRSWLGVAPQLDHMGALDCLWSMARTGDRGTQWWGMNGSGYWYGSDPPPAGVVGHGDCLSPWFTAASPSSHYNSRLAGTHYYANDNSVVFYYADAYIDTYGSHHQVSLSQIVKELRARSDVRDDAVLVGVAMMADEPIGNQPWHHTWYGNITRPKGYGSWDPHLITWGPDPAGGWWSSGISDAEPGQWMSHPLTHGISPKTAGGYYDADNNFVPFTGPDQWWLPFPMDLITGALSYEADPTNSTGGTDLPRGLTLAYLPDEIAHHEPPAICWAAFDRTNASSDDLAWGHRLLLKVRVQEPAFYGTTDPLGGNDTFPRVMIKIPTIGGDFPDPYDPGPIDSQILFGPYPIQFAPVIDVLVFGPRHKPYNSWPAMQTKATFDAELRTHDPEPVEDPFVRPMASARFELPEFTMVEGKPVAAKATGRIAFTSETVPPSTADQLYATPHLVNLGEDLRFPPILATSQTNTSTYRRHPNDPLEYRTRAEVTSLRSYDGSVVLASPLPGPERVSSYAYWRGNPAATTAVSFRANSTGEESLIADVGQWITGDQFTILLAAVIDDRNVVGSLSPLFTTAAPSAQPTAGLFFNANSEILLWDNRYDVADPAKRITGSLQLLDDIRTVAQPVLVGARIDNTTGRVTLVAADSRLRTVEASLTAPIPVDQQLLIGDANALTGPGSFDLLDMRWWRRSLSDAELMSAAAAMCDLWGVLQ